MSGRTDERDETKLAGKALKCRYCGSIMSQVMAARTDGTAVGYCPMCEGPVTSLPPGDNVERMAALVANILRLRPGRTA